MTLDRPWALALLAVPVVLLWLRLRDARPRDAEASSLLVWRRVAPADAAAARPRPPLAAWIEAAGAALIVLAIANPVADGVRPPLVRVLLDVSPSARDRTPPVESFVNMSHIPEDPEIKADVVEDLEGRLPGALTGSTPLVVMTDRRLPAFPDDPPRFQVVGVGRPGFNAGITAASGVPIGNGRWRLTVTIEAFGARGPVEGALVLGTARERITLTPGTPLEITRETASGIASAGVEFPDDALDADDRVALAARGGEPVRARFEAALRGSPLVRALDSAGAEMEEDAGSEAAIRLEPLSAGAGQPLEIRLPADADGPEVSGAGVTSGSSPLVRDVRIDPSVTLGRRGNPPAAGDVLLSDAAGTLATAASREGTLRVQLGFAPGGTWVDRDPSFVVFAKNLVDFAAGGPARIEATGLLDARETREAAEGESFGDLAEALAAAARPDVAAGYSVAPLLLGLAAIALALAWWLARG